MSVLFVPEIEPESGRRRLNRLCTAYEKRSVLNVVFLTQFGKERSSRDRVSCRGELLVQQSVRIRIDRSVQPVALITEPNHRFVDHNVIRTLASFRL
jgi:hypothetical protein